MKTDAAPCDDALPLKGVKVLDLTRALAGPYCTMILGDLGADVIKIEPIDGGDMIRNWGPHDRDISAYYLSGNRNKRGVAVNFRDPAGLALIRELAGRSDVVVENFRNGAMDAMGLSFDSLRQQNPGLVYAGITGFGRSGPAGNWPGFDQIAQGYSGFMSLTGTAESGPMRTGVAIGDQAAGMWAALGVVAALFERSRTGQGRRVETSLLSGLLALLSVQGQRYLSLGEVPERSGNSHPVIAPYGVFETADGPLNIAPATTDMWRKLCDVLDLEHLIEDPRFADNAARVAHRTELKETLESKLRQHDRKHWTRAFISSGIPAGPINDLKDVFADEQIGHCALVEPVQHPTLGEVRLVGSPIRFDGQMRSVRLAPPLLGQHTREVLEAYGVSPSRIDALLTAGTIAQG